MTGAGRIPPLNEFRGILLTAIEEYHLSRTMFAIKDNVLYLHMERTTMDHIEWFKSLRWIADNESEVINTALRGYVSDHGIYFYKGYDGNVSSQDIEIFISHLHSLCNLMKLDESLPIYAGVHIGNPGEIFKPRKCLGNVAILSCKSNDKTESIA